MVLWFKAKKYGYGWYPSTWQGWLIIAVYIFLVISQVLEIDTSPASYGEFPYRIFIWIALYTLGLIFICYAKGEKATWRWGDKK